MITKQLIFDTTAILDDNDNVGAFLRSATGTLITDTGGSLNVNVTNSVTVTATDLDIRDLDSATDSVTAVQGTSPWVIGDGGGSITVDGTVAVTQSTSPWVTSSQFQYAEDTAHVSGDIGAFTLGIRNDANAVLTSTDGDYSPFAVDSAGRMKIVGTFTSSTAYAEDSASASGDMGDFVLAVRQDTLTSSTSTDGDYAAFKENARGALWTSPVGTAADGAADTENPVKVGSKVKTGALTSTANNNRADLTSDDFRRVYVNSGANVSVLNTAVSATTSATAVPATPLIGRRYILIQNLENKKVYLGGSAVTSSTGIEISAKGSWEGEVGDDVALFILTTAGTADIRVQELA